MTRFKYKAQLASGKIVSGISDAADEKELSETLKEDGMFVMNARVYSGTEWDMERINGIFITVSLREKILFARNLSRMIKAGLSISRALEILVKQTENPQFRKIIQMLKEDVKKGTSFSDALAKHEKAFPPVFIAMMRAGEESGGVVEALMVTSRHMEKSYTLKKKMRSAMMYPAMVLLVMIIVAVLMMIYVVPGLATTFKEANAELPATTKLIIAISEFLQNDYLFAIIIVSVASLLFWMFKKTDVGNHILTWLVFRAPTFGKLVKEFNAAMVTRTLSSLMIAGVGIVRALEITEDVVSNVYYKEALNKAKGDVQGGIPLSRVFVVNSDIFPAMVGDMMEVGEETGDFSGMLLDIAQFYEEEVDTATADMAKLVEPMLMMIIAVFVGVFAVAMLTPMYSLVNNI